MKKLLLTLSVAAAVTVGTILMPTAEHLNAAPVNCDSSPVQNSLIGPRVVMIDRTDGLNRLKELYQKCNLQLHYLYWSSCIKDSAESMTPPDTNVPETVTPEETQPVPPSSEITVPDTSQPETETPEVSVPLPQPPVTSPEEEIKPSAPSAPSLQPPVTSPEEDTDSTETVHPYVLRVAELVNEERAKAGIDPVTLDTTANQAALIRAEEIVSSFSHTRPNGSSFVTALKEQGINYRLAGENIAWGQKTPEQVMNGWMNSSGHRANILNASYTHIGVGYYQKNGVNYWTQLFYQ